MSDSEAREGAPLANLLTGSCLCGGVRYRAEGPLSLVARCHCIWCRKQSGAEFATNGSVDAERFELLAGESLLRSFETSPGQKRFFCRVCGSSVLKRDAAKPELIRLRLGCLDSDFDQPIEARVFTSRKLAISEFHDDIPSFETSPGAVSQAT